jgi:hypothetical protein
VRDARTGHPLRTQRVGLPQGSVAVDESTGTVFVVDGATHSITVLPAGRLG